ncbi:tetratricopeptide repeat protein [Robiginitalea sediminis]|uniref:tetratricopeptide repeat protein n=1 Tax=Robiginitalea sediminis TaxID=1982593 RepID=UPI000B4A960B|nr:tetratricopeptide repeat protein [Robiginitalea sediminis]
MNIPSLIMGFLKSGKTLVLSFLLCSALASSQQRINRSMDSLLNLLKTQKDTQLILTYRAVYNDYMADDPERAKAYLDTAIVLARDVKSTNVRARLLHDLAYYHNRLGNYTKSEELYLKAIDSFAKAKNLGMLQVAHNVLGVVQKNRGRFDDALKSYMNSLKYSDTLGDSEYYRLPTFHNLGVLLAEMGEWERSNEYYRKTIAASEKYDEFWGAAIARSNMATNMVSNGEYEKALPIYLEALTFFESEQYEFETGEQYAHLGELYMELGDYEKSKSALLRSQEIGKKTGELAMQITAGRHLGELYLRMKQPEASLRALNQALNLASEADYKPEIIRLLKQIGDTYATQGKYKEAYAYRDRHFLAYDSTFQKEKVEQINALEIRYQTAQKEADIALKEEEINTLNEKAKVDKLSKSLYAGGMFSFLAISGGLFFGFRQRIKRNRIAREKQEAIFRQEIEHKKKELASQTLHLVQKNTFLEELQENLENLRKSPEKFKMEFRRIAMLLRKEKASDKDWETFKTYFAQVHNDFDQKLKTLSPDISEKEIRLAAFLRMNLTTKEIAATMNVLPESILKSKYRLKKKLGLEKDMDLGTFLASI